jgi:hypothetical protein
MAAGLVVKAQAEDHLRLAKAVSLLAGVDGMVAYLGLIGSVIAQANV